LIEGFIVSGTDSKRVIVRALGPSLTSYGVSGALADPILELHDHTGAIIASNDNWKDTQQSQIVATNLAPHDDHESAIVITLASGAYTAIARGVSNTSGVVLLEIYDLDPSANSRLINVSARGYVDLGDNVLIGGTILGAGNGGVNLVVARALGPSLRSFGVQNAMQNPVLELHNQQGTLLDSNDNWKVRSDGSSQQADIEATTIPPTNDLESAILTTVGAASYTVVVRGKDGTSGLGLVEVYRLY